MTAEELRGPVPAELDHAYATCTRLARRHYENFPVASWLLPRAMRPHVAAVYAFARIADDFADEGIRSVEERHRLLDHWRARLRSCVSGSAPAAAADSPEDRVFLALGHTICARRLPVSLFEDLLSAFRQDVTITRYPTWDDVLDYCRRSAHPVGRLVLRIAGYEDRLLDRSSDALCTALQLTNFWQDLARDWQRGRLYVPTSLVLRHRARFEDLDEGRLGPAWLAVMREAASRTWTLFADGRTVCARVRGRLRLQLRLTWLGGSRVLERVQRKGFNVFARRPALGTADVPGLLWKAVTWKPE